MQTLLVFDYATTGSDPSRDRPVEFACLRLDTELNIVGGPTSLHCEPPPDCLFDPATCVATGITPQLCEQLGLPELQFVGAIYRELGTPGTIGVGYDSIAFDDEITRFTFWRNLIDPYAREWKNGCGRWDLIELVRATYALRPETLSWPRDEDSDVVFALDELTAANGLLHESAHDALSNVYATIALARHTRDRQTQLYAHMFSMRDKTRALLEMDAGRHTPFLHVAPDTSAAAGIRVMLPLAVHPTNRNEIIAWDLSKDPRQLLDIDAESVRLRLFTRPDDRPDGLEPMPLYAIAANRSPAVFKNLHVLSRERAAELGIDVRAALDNVPVMLGVMDTIDVPQLLQVVYARDPVECDAEEALYEGFIGQHDRRLLDQLRTLDPVELRTIQPIFTDPRLDELFLRYKARHYPASLSGRELDKWEEHRFRKLITGHSGSRTVAMVRAAASRLREAPSVSGDLTKAGILDDVLAYTNALAVALDPYEIVPDSAAPAETAPLKAPSQPDLFGHQDMPSVTPPRR